MESQMNQIASNDSIIVRVKKTESSNPRKDNFNKFLENVKLTKLDANTDASDLFNEINGNLKTKSHVLSTIDKLSEEFESLLRKAESDKRSEQVNWSDLETNFLVSLVTYYCLSANEDFKSLSDKDWQYFEALFPTKQAHQISKQWNCLLKISVRQCPWTDVEDQELIKLVDEFGAGRNWRVIAEKLNRKGLSGAHRETRQCKDRWIKHLDPRVNKGTWTQEEDLKLLKAYMSIGKKWAEIAKKLGTRTDIAIKTRFSNLVKAENKQADSLSANLCRSDEAAERAAVARLIEKLAGRDKKETKRVIKPNAKATNSNETVTLVPLSDAKTAELAGQSQSLTLKAGNEAFSFRVQNPMPFPQLRINFEPMMIFGLVDMNKNRIHLF